MTTSQNPRGSEPRSGIGAPVLQYVAAWALVFSTTSLLLYAVGRLRSGGDPARVAREALGFALSRAGVMSAASVSAGVLAALALAGLRDGSSIAARLRLGPTRASAVGWLAALTGMAGLSAAAGAAASALRELLGAAGGTLELIGHALSRATPAGLLLQLLTIALLPGAAEEMFFRGLLQTRLVAGLPRWPAILLTAAAFGLIHFDPFHSVLAFVAGTYLGWLTERFGGIRPAMGAHVFNNALFVLFVATGRDEEPSGAGRAAILVAGAAVWLVATAVARSPLALRRDARGGDPTSVTA
ncbi:MAG: CPBP family intramembrane metalloprotease [Myxococcales bacterium]|nr:CPBP family intramembrane metalloprotease [Myxococcales bacterium]